MNKNMKMKMNKNMIKVAFVAAIAIASGINVIKSQKPVVLSDVAMANVEALSDYEVIPGYRGPAEIYVCYDYKGNVKGEGILCKSENNNDSPCSAVLCK